MWQIRELLNSQVAQLVKNLLAMQKPGFDPWVGMIPWRREWQLIPVFLSGKSHGQRSLLAYSPWSHKRVGNNLVIKQ